VNRSDLKELHYITPVANIPSIMQRGILCKNRANKLNPASIAMPEIQQLRASKAVPGGLQIHDYVNFYFSARNPMMYKRSSLHANLCVLRIDTSVLDLKNTVIADSNVASKYVAFWPSPSGLAKINDSWVFADDWTDGDQITQWRKAAAKCAEVLVPSVVPPDRITGAYVSCPESQRTLVEAGFDRSITVNPHLFFRG
jgi:ssDNA thymidine ADP-ribosyltransferase DarT-like protein